MVSSTAEPTAALSSGVGFLPDHDAGALGEIGSSSISPMLSPASSRTARASPSVRP